MPNSHTAFGSEAHLTRLHEHGLSLEPNTKYEVRGRGTFYTDAHGNLADYAEITHREHTLLGSLLRNGPAMSPELRHPRANTTYFVDDYAYLKTDEHARPATVVIHGLEHKPDTARSVRAQRNVAGGTDYDAGHLAARLFGSPREESFLTRMDPGANRGVAGNPHTFKAVETAIERHLNTHPDDTLTYRIDIKYHGGAMPEPGRPWTTPPNRFLVTARNESSGDLLRLGSGRKLRRFPVPNTLGAFD